MDVKSIFASKTIWGGVIMLAPTVLGFFNLSLTPQDATDAVTNIQAIVNDVITAVGFFTVVWGRMHVTAKATITGK